MINVLPKQIAELISAGEVVERPVSVVKELVENAIDAHAKRIIIEIQRGGITFMRITDDGIGMCQEDVPKAFIRFATSKISTKEDLDKIMTLGFRGEALASVSAVAKVEVLTKTRDEPFGTHYIIEGSEEILNEKTGCPDGTTINVRDLFYNVPVRAKFLKRDVVEGNAISNIVKKLAISHPEIAFTFIREGKTEFITYGVGEQYSAVYSIYGKTFAKDLIAVDYTEGGVSVKGYTVKPLYAKSNRQYQMFFVNGRFVKSDILSTALEEAYESNIMTGKFPVCVLDLELPPDSIDVNIHPTKAEVRFSNENEVFNAVFFAVKNSLMSNGLTYELDLAKTKSGRALEKVTPKETYVEPNLPNVDLPNNDTVVNAPVKEDNPFIFDSHDEEFEKAFNSQGVKDNIQNENSKAIEEINNSTDDFIFSEDIDKTITTEPKLEPIPTPVEPPKPKSVPNVPVSKNVQMELPTTSVKPTPKEELPNLDNVGVVTRPSFYKNKNMITEHGHEVKLIGEGFKNYIMVEYHDEIIIIDKHAGHERLIYEKLKSQSAYTDRQILLDPITMLINEDQSTALQGNQDLCKTLGFEFKFDTLPWLKVTAIPEILTLDDVIQAVTEVADNLLLHKHNPQTTIIDNIIHDLACKSAIRSNDKTSDVEMLSLAKQIIFNEKIRHCPHGRPVMFTMSRKDLEKQFKRIV